MVPDKKLTKADLVLSTK